MIQSFADKEAEKIFSLEHSKKLPTEIQQRALDKMNYLDTVSDVEDLRMPPSNRLHRLSGNMQGRWAICINAQWRITFSWGANGPEAVKIEDYH